MPVTSAEELSQRAIQLLDSLRGRPLSGQQAEEHAIQLATWLHSLALRLKTPAEQDRDAQLSRMMNDPRGQAFTTLLTDRTSRSSSPERTLEQLDLLLQRFGPPAYLSPVDRGALSLAQKLGRLAPKLATRAMTDRIQRETATYILSADTASLDHYLKQRAREACRVNVNKLGEEVLSEAEAERRTTGYLKLLKRPDVSTISVKISSIFSQVDCVAFDHSLSEIQKRLRQIYRAALKDSAEQSKLVYLDMEAYRDLELTWRSFQSLLDEPEFQQLSAGIVLQAYVPDSATLQETITDWALARRAKGGAPIRLRIVKGANLAMERVEAAQRNWEQPIYETKLEVDANFKRIVRYACDSKRVDAVQVGIATHNVFDLAYALILRASAGVESSTEVEVLEGMANSLRLSLAKLQTSVLVYAPFVESGGFSSAVAYLVRRLDENTSKDNFLHHSFGMRVGDEAWNQQKRAFSAACALSTKVSTQARRRQHHAKSVEPTFPADSSQSKPSHHNLEQPFRNEPDTDFTSKPRRDQIALALRALQEQRPVISSEIPGGSGAPRKRIDGFDPSRPGVIPYTLELADAADVEQALANSILGTEQWSATAPSTRAQAIVQVADRLREARAELIALMVQDAGKRVDEADTEVSEAIDFAEYYARQLLSLLSVPTLSCTPRGLTVVTPPWNFPLAIPLGGVFAALLAGNPVILKPALETPRVARRAAELCWDAGIPKTALQLVITDDECATPLITDPRVQVVVLTGATSTAELFFKLRPDLYLLAETGGKNSLYISPMADRELAIKDTLASAFGHAGQKCSALSLLILHSELYDDADFLTQLKAATESLGVGSAWDPENRVTPLIHEPSDLQRRALTELNAGETWLVEPKIHPDNPRLCSPGIKLGVAEASSSHRTEYFCPLLSVMRASDLEHALRLANGTKYGLTSGIHTLDEREQQQWIDGIEAGNVYVNRKITGAIVQRQPFGGFKASSFGSTAKAGGPHTLRQYFKLKNRTALRIASEHPAPERRSYDAVALRRFEQLCAPLYSFIHRQPEAEALVRLGLHYLDAYFEHYATPRDPSNVLGEHNHLRTLPLSGVVILAGPGTSPRDVLAAHLAAAVCETPVQTLVPPGSEWAEVCAALGAERYESETALAEHLAKTKAIRLRNLGPPLSKELLQLIHGRGLTCLNEPVSQSGLVELLYYLKEQAVSVSYHRYGNLGAKVT